MVRDASFIAIGIPERLIAPHLSEVHVTAFESGLEQLAKQGFSMESIFGLVADHRDLTSPLETGRLAAQQQRGLNWAQAGTEIFNAAASTATGFVPGGVNRLR